MPFQTTKNALWVFPALFLVTAPRVVNLSLFFSQFMDGTPAYNKSYGFQNATESPNLHDPATTQVVHILDDAFEASDNSSDFQNTTSTYKFMFSVPTLFGCFFIYCVSLFAVTLLAMAIDMKLIKMIFLNLAYGVLSPCIVLHPKSRLLMFTTLISTLSHILLSSSLLVLKHFTEYTLIKVEDTVVLSLVVGLILSLFPAYFLHWMSYEENRQKFGLVSGLGSLSCLKEEALIWACSNNYPRLVRLSRKFLLDPKTKQGFQTDHLENNAVQISCIKGEYINAISILLKTPY